MRDKIISIVGTSCMDKSDLQHLQEFLSSCPHALLYYTPNYIHLLERFLGITAHYNIVMDHRGKIKGILIAFTKKGSYGEICNSLPFFGSNGGIIATDPSAYDLLLEYYQDLSQSMAVSVYIENPLKPSQGIPYELVEIRRGQWTHLADSQKLLKNFEPSTRRNIKKALREGVKPVLIPGAMEFLWRLHHKNITSIGGLAKPKRFFELLQDIMQPGIDYDLWVAIWKDRQIAGLLVLYFNRVVEYFTPVTDREYRSLQAQPLLIYTAMVHAAQKGYKLWNFGGTWTSQHSLYRFKRKFGAFDKPYRYFIRVNNPDILYASPQVLMSEYKWFYIVPFSHLKSGAPSNEDPKN